MEHAPTAMNLRYKQKQPDIKSVFRGNDGSIRIKHREYIQDIIPTNTYAVNSFPINPGLSTFPWLQVMALNYESYLFNSLSFEFASEAATTDRGAVFMMVDFDAADVPPASKQEFMSNQNAVRSTVWSHCTYRASSADLQKFGKQRYMRSGTVPSGTDIKTYDVGTFYIGTQGITSVSTIGELYVEYDVTFHTPQGSSQNLYYSNSAKFYFANASQSGSQPFGSGPATQAGLLPVSYRDGNSLLFSRVGEYLMVYQVGGTGIDDTDPMSFTSTGNSITLVQPFTANGGIEGIAVILLKVNNVGSYIVNTIANTTTVTSCFVRIAAYAYTNS